MTMQSPSSEEIQLELVESTTVLNKLLNCNCCFDGSILTHLAGASLAQHNVFQNTKHFIPRATPYTPVALAFQKAADTTTALISKLGPRTFLEFYLSDKPPIVIELHYDLKVYDCLFLERKKVCILCLDLVRNVSMVMLVSSSRKLTKFQTNTPLVKFVHGDRRLLMLKGKQNDSERDKNNNFSFLQGKPSSKHTPENIPKGCIEFEVETQSIGQSFYEDQIIKDFLSIDEAEIVITPENHLLVHVDQKIIQDIDLGQFGGEWSCGTRLSRSVLVAFKGELTLGHFKWIDGRLEWTGRYQYPERLRANIVNLQHSADQMNIVLATQIFHKDSWTMEFFLFNCSALSADKKFINAYTRLLPSGAETGDIVSLQKVVASDIFLLSGPSIVNYSYIDHIEKKHKYVIHESPRLIAVHPLGFQILCTFEGSVKFYQKVEQQLLEIWSESWSCSSAKYTESGLLLLCIFEEGSHQIVLYDPNSFKRLKVYSHLYLKHAVTAIDFDETESQMILWSGRDLSVYKLKTGEKLSQFRQKKECLEALCVQYDSARHLVLVGLKNGLVICKKNQQYHLNFSSQKRVDLDEDVTSILIKENIQTAFLGCADGKILVSSYPLKPHEEILCQQTFQRITYKSIGIHSSPVADLLLTNNNKYLFSSSKGEGLAIIKIKKNAMGGYYNAFDISNYNFIETSSKPYLEMVQQKLKGLLEKRKAIFNQLDEYKKEWESKRQQESKSVNVQHKKKELTAVNSALDDIFNTKSEHERLMAELNDLETLEKETFDKKQNELHENLLICYSENDRLKKQREEIQKRCAQQFEEIERDCFVNFKDIESEIKIKFEEFEENYKIMRHNLLCFTLKGEIEAKEEQILADQEIQQTRTRLRKEEDELYRKNNEIKGEITRNKKELERYINRRDFLQNKQRFFSDELKFCGSEQKQLREIKQQLEEQLKELQKDTQKKEKRLRKYFLQNQMLLKYQIVHDNLTKATEREISFEEEQHSTLRSQIHQLQKEIILLSDNKTYLHKETAQKLQVVTVARKNIKELKAKGEYLELQIRELERLLATVGPGREQELQGLYEKFFVGKRLEGAIECPIFQEKEKAETKQQEKKIRQQLEAHKEYLVKNMNTFQKVNTKAFEEIHLSYLKYQSQNYALISQCNVRKEQITKKKRILQEMVNSVRETQNYMNQLQNAQPNLIRQMTQHKRDESQPKLIPFVEYERQQVRKEKSESSLYKSRVAIGQVRKMLDVQRLTSPESRVKPTRRIQTANIKKKQESGEIVAQQDCGGWMITKPQTACRRRGAQQEARRLFSRNKSSSKPTTATSHSKHSVFI